MENEAKKYAVGCVILAAGLGRRFGGGKLEARFRGSPLYALAFRTVPLEKLSAAAVVSGSEEILAAAEAAGFLPVRNDRPEDGISRSIRLGLSALGGVDAALFLVADQPLLTRATVERVLSAGEAGPGRIVAPVRSDGQPGNPCLFPAAFFPELLALEGDRGGKRVIAAHPEAFLAVPAPDAELADADSREALAELEGE
jgi:molybdenum cofactor cytidylyltransferase